MPAISDIIQEISRSMRVKETQVYSGEPIELQWQSVSAKDLPVTFSLKWGMEKEVIGNSSDATALYDQSIVLKTDIAKEVNFELIVELREEDDFQEQTISFPSVLLHPPVIQSFTADEEVPLGSSAYLSWKAKGEVSFYELKIGNSDWRRLPSGTTQYRDPLDKPMSYQLRGYSGTPEAPVLLKGQPLSKNVRVFYPPYQSSHFFPTDNNVTGVTVFALALAPDNSKLYIAGDETISVVDASTQKALVTIPVKKGFKTMGLSADGSKLYVADRLTRSLSIISTQDYKLIMDPIVLKAMPKALLIADEIAKLFIAVEGGIILTLDLAKNTLLIDPLNQINLTTIPHSEAKTATAAPVNIGSLAIVKGSLYAAHSNGNVISKINIANGLMEYKGRIQVGDNPRAIAFSVSENKFYVTNAGNNTLSVIDAEKGAKVEDIILADCDNPESLAVVMPPHASAPLLYVTGGFKNCIVKVDRNNRDEKEGSSVPTMVGLNPHLLIANTDGSRVYTVCANGLWSFWTQKRYLENKKILAPDKKKVPILPPIPSSQPSADSQWVLDKQKDMERRRAERDEGLRKGAFGMFFPNLRQNSISLPDDTQTHDTGNQDANASSKTTEEKLTSKPLANNTPSEHAVVKNPLLLHT